MYDAGHDPYVYPGTAVLKNKLDIRQATQLERFEFLASQQRASETPPRGRLGYRHFLAIHRHLFQDIYTWAGKPRTVRLSKQQSVFCYPEHIDKEMRRIFVGLAKEHHLRGLERGRFIDRAAYYLSEINAVHPFREGNGRTQLLFMTMLAEKAGHPVHVERLDPDAFMKAMIASFDGDLGPLKKVLRHLVRGS